jgi:acyl carrier protein|tara:strand:+ start:132 stop:371 length:240 start_codon:yes stop_codon:yes gene_type:complete
MDIQEKVIQVLVNVFQVSPSKISTKTTSDDVEKWDSMNHINMILVLEQEFGIRYDEEQVVSMLSVEEIIDVTKGMLGLQ